MAASIHQEVMLKKPVFMPPSMIQKVDRLAQSKKVSFARVVREAVDAFDGENSSDTDVLELLADTMIETTQEVITKIEAIEKRLDSTHDMLEQQ